MIRRFVLALPVLALSFGAFGCAAEAGDDADAEENTEQALTAALSAPVYECDVPKSESIAGTSIPESAIVVPFGKKAVVELERDTQRTGNARQGYYGESVIKVDEDANVTKKAKVVTVAANGYSIAIDTAAKVRTTVGELAFTSKITEGSKTYPMVCRPVSQKDWFNENVRTSQKPSEFIYAEVVRINQVPAEFRAKLEKASKDIDIDAEDPSTLSPGARYFKVYYTSSRKTVAGYLVWAGTKDGADGEIERVIWAVGFTVDGKEILREFADMRG